MELSDVDLLDPDVFRTGRHHEMFRVLRAEDPVHWTERARRPGLLEHHPPRRPDRGQPRRRSVFSSAEQGISIPDIAPEGEMVREMMLYMDPPRHTRYRLLVNKGFTPRMIGLLETGLRTKCRLIVDNVIEPGECDFVIDIASELPAAGHRRAHGRARRGPPQAVRLDEPHDRHRRPRVRGRPRVGRRGRRRAVHVRQQPGRREAPGR